MKSCLRVKIIKAAPRLVEGGVVRDEVWDGGGQDVVVADLCDGDGVGVRRDGLDDGLEAVDRVGRVLDHPDAAVRVDEGVLPLDDVAVARLGVRLLVARQRVAHAVLVVELRPRLVLGRFDPLLNEFSILTGPSLITSAKFSSPFVRILRP